VPTADDTPTASAAFSLVIPVAICFQNSRSVSRRCDGAPGERIVPRPINVCIHPAGRPINTSKVKVLRRPVECTQYTSARYRKQLNRFGIRASMGDVGACWDNAVVERFFGSLKHDWLFKVSQPTREQMKKDVADYIRYYNLQRLHSANGGRSPVDHELVFKNVSGIV
jgi:hypothetical protein